MLEQHITAVMRKLQPEQNVSIYNQVLNYSYPLQILHLTESNITFAILECSDSNQIQNL